MNATHEGQDAADVLERAAQIMAERGKLSPGDNMFCRKVCAIMAIHSATQCNRLLTNEALIPLRAFLLPIPIYEWSDSNDAPTVIVGLRAIAATERARAATLRAQQAAPVAAEPVAVTA